MLRRTPGFSLLAILCLTLGVGANTTIFSWIKGILSSSLPCGRPSGPTGRRRRNQPRRQRRGSRQGLSYTDVSWPDFVDLRRNCTLIDAFIADKIMGTTLSVGDRAEK